MAIRRFLALVLLTLLAACQAALPKGAQCWSLLGRPLHADVLAPDVLADRQAKLASAQADLLRRPQNREAAIWVGRRLGYLGRYREAIDTYTAALEKWPGDAFLLRHRGHRYLSVRAFDLALADLELAARACRNTPDEVEPDGLPVPGRPPHSTLHFNVHYHRALASFVLGDHAQAALAWLDCLAVCHNDESRVAVTHWLWSARMRSGDPAGAAAVVAGMSGDMDIVENQSYYQLCLLYAGLKSRAQVRAAEGSAGAALRFGLAHYDLVTGSRQSARQQFVELAGGPGWAAFGAIAAEAELANWR